MFLQARTLLVINGMGVMSGRDLLAVSFHCHIGLHWDYLAVLILVHAILCYLEKYECHGIEREG